MGIGFVLDEEGNIITFNDPEKNIQQSLKIGRAHV